MTTFDLDTIEKDWKDNSFCLTEEDIIKIYQSEGVTLKKYNDEVDTFRKENRCTVSIEEQLYARLFQDEEILKKIELERKAKAAKKFPEKKRLSKSSMQKVVEGSMSIVFDSTRYWYSIFEGNIPLENIYYVCLESLISSVKYLLHNEKPWFSSYVKKGIEVNIIDYFSRINHIKYRESREIVRNIEIFILLGHSDLKDNDDFEEFFSDKEVEIPEKPSKIYYLTRNKKYDTDYVRNISSQGFMTDYKKALNNLDDLSKQIMQLSFDVDGYPGLTLKEIGEYLGIEDKQVYNIKRKALRKLRKEDTLIQYNI